MKIHFCSLFTSSEDLLCLALSRFRMLFACFGVFEDCNVVFDQCQQDQCQRIVIMKGHEPIELAVP